MSRPLIFISHKHADRAIATVVRSFITEQTRSMVSVFQSSDPAAMTPAVGRTLNQDLRTALWHAGAVILVYTSEDQDWGYCMWECGVAMLPDSPDTRIILFQCGDSAPSLFAGQLGVNVRDRTSIETFVTQFMTDAEFMPRAKEPLTGYHKTDQEVQKAASRLFDDLQAVLPEGPSVEWPAHPYLQLQLSSADVKAILQLPDAERPSAARALVMSNALVSACDKYVNPLFGLAQFAPDMRLQALCSTWEAAYPQSSNAWTEALIDQIVRAAQWQFPVLKWTAMASVTDGRLYAPVLTRVRKVPSNSMYFDVYFYPFNLMDATPATSRMVSRTDMLCRVLEHGHENQVSLMELLRELDEHRYTRMPFLDTEGRLVYIAHRSMLDQFVSRQLRAGRIRDWEEVTLADVFTSQPEIRTMFASTAAFVGSAASLGEAKAAMNATANCYDVFITDSGDPGQPILGWLTDVIIASSEMP